ncbi:hypothetical protein KVT40_000234 [Elsinoe batatas]|uniref:Ima1 N-terminal domain-containing protein n=1 Tax=Elsinoe batatas TaxID=2601811 RepID=A0A8K0PMI7_9PEZI|nr:hypothetical protein KVT40_000234 [Elsinoe batatas]
MPSLLRPRIKCFYCGGKSPHRKGDELDRFQCASCEGTNFLDENGDITDVPHDPIATPSRTDRKYAVQREPSLSPPNRVDDSADSLFCKNCLTNQHFLSQRLADYLPDEEDPRYDEFLAAYPAYKKDIERRYPPVCSKCEPRVRERLKKTSYAAKSDILARSLGKNHNQLAYFSAGSAWTLPRLLLISAEALWWSNNLIQAAWHLLGAKEALPSVDRDSPVQQIRLNLIGRCVKSAVQARPLHPLCNVQFAALVQYSLGVALAMLWWNPTLLRLRGVRTTNKISFYTVQVAILAFRATAWWYLREQHGLDLQTTKAAHALSLAIIAMTLLLSYRIIGPAPRQKVEFRSLDTPLVDRDAIQHPQEEFISQATLTKRAPEAFNIGNLKPRSAFSPTGISSGSSTTPPLQRFRPPPESDADSMDWEPSHVPPLQPLRPRGAALASPGQVVPGIVQPSTTSTAPKVPSPFYGSLPPAPKSMEARIRGAAQNPPPQFKPTSDSKQADWFKRMGLAQSQTSWANKDYVRTVDQEDERNYELQEGKLNLETLGLQKNDGTGLEDLFGRSFRINDDSPIKEAPAGVDPASHRWGVIEMGAVAVPITLAAWLALTYLAPTQAWAIGSWVQSATDWTHTGHDNNEVL